MNLGHRPRRNRKSPAIRSLVRENSLSPADFVLPLFLHEDAENTPIDSMPGVTRWSLDGLVEEAKQAFELGIPAVVLFPKIPDEQKSPKGDECYNDDGLVPRAVRALKAAVPALTVITDIALDPYNSDGHDGIVTTDEHGNQHILNDETVDILCEQALCHARAGADIVSPSDMMDGRIGEIRAVLDEEGFENVSVLSYSVKYASAFYGPFRGALDSAPKEGDKKTYQMDPANRREALREVVLDEEEGADMVMVKPAGAYLDVISAVREATVLPLAAYQVSGEYLMLKSAADAGWIDEQAAVLESLTAIKRAGADFILTYFAKQAAGWLRND
ncbi:porphobilinogen synthase [Sulfuriroseicoccus oceanibius]|uniref:Delta-aminolevulinic acid dehydratase n=1 Tax=Sulfuriroseicoccus oceanibius TaxID=2707525 RepID=A0A6B3LF79_9BACT|nr:porphobilinogen synthase [Sulfuriroseicoccus oceanibius]QQL45442.1 porphobilinogen synthase [Sulfuriroseicoccus oceanibius]